MRLHKYSVPAQAQLSDDRFVVLVERVQSAADATNYIVDVTIENVTQVDQTFAANTLELLDPVSGVSFPVLTPNAGMQASFGMLSEVTLKPGRKAQGRVYFQTRPGEAQHAKLELHFGDQTLQHESLGYLSDDDLDARSR